MEDKGSPVSQGFQGASSEVDVFSCTNPPVPQKRKLRNNPIKVSILSKSVIVVVELHEVCYNRYVIDESSIRNLV
jgi:hypothetical protein